jgi:Cysteine-rich secretory protein family.
LIFHFQIGRYNEIRNYDFDNVDRSGNNGSGHFTQLVWKESTEVGCGKGYQARDGLQFEYVVCQYSPAGNFMGKYKTNVNKLRPGESLPADDDLF